MTIRQLLKKLRFVNCHLVNYVNGAIQFQCEGPIYKLTSFEDFAPDLSVKKCTLVRQLDQRKASILFRVHQWTDRGTIDPLSLCRNSY